MRKIYPYLEESYTPFSRIPQELSLNYPYLMESSYNYNVNEEKEKQSFLSKIDNIINQKQYVNITLLDWKEDPIKEIQGIISTGSITKDGESTVRRIANLTCSLNREEYNIDNIEMDFALNKKVFIEIGIENKTDEYLEYPILWFPQGVFYIDSFNINSTVLSPINLTLSLKDKMCLLNGDISGTFPATVQFDTMTTQSSDGQILEEQPVLYYNLLVELLNHWGKEDLNNIVIQDVPLRIRQIVQWNGDKDIYLGKYLSEETGTVYYQCSFEEPGAIEYTKYSAGDDIGYVYADFCPISEITAAAGDNICSVLDTIKNQLGNYEYFYDVFGVFHFREIKNYLNINQSETILQETENPGRYISLEKGQFCLDINTELQYLIDVTNEKTCFSFDDAKNITSITTTPNYNNIKNDFVINGIQKTASGMQRAIRYRLVIDNKPEIMGYTNATHDAAATADDENAVPYYGVFNDLLYYTHPDYVNDETVLETNKLGKWFEVESLPTVGNMDQIYHIKDDTKYYIWSGTKYNEVYLKEDLSDPEAQRISPEVYSEYYATDWRTFLLCYGLEANANGTDPGVYYTDLASFWPDEYDLRRENQKFFGEEEDGSIHFKTLTSGNFYFDIIDSNSSSLGIYSVDNIGRRADVVNDDNVNCLFTPEIPNVVFLNSEHPEQNWSENTMVTELRSVEDITDMLNLQREECNQNGQPWIQVPDDVFSNLLIGGYLNGAYEAIRYELFLHTNYQKTLNVTSIPIYYLEPNTRVSMSETSTNTFGDYIVKNINISLGVGNNSMSVTMNEAFERL